MFGTLVFIFVVIVVVRFVITAVVRSNRRTGDEVGDGDAANLPGQPSADVQQQAAVLFGVARRVFEQANRRSGSAPGTTGPPPPPAWPSAMPSGDTTPTVTTPVVTTPVVTTPVVTTPVVTTPTVTTPVVTTPVTTRAAAAPDAVTPAHTAPAVETPRAPEPTAAPDPSPDPLATSLSTSLADADRDLATPVVGGPQVVALPAALQARVLELMAQNYEVMAVRLVCDEMHVGILDAQKTVRTLAGLPSPY